MDVKQMFRCMVSNQFLPDINYSNCSFSFQTVFHRTAYSYCCCSCGFEHEYFDYISESGDINEDIYEKIVTSIIDGKCPHVDGVPEKYIMTSSVHGVHIAAAVGTEEAMHAFYRQYRYIDSSIFKLSPFRTALVKHQIEIVNIANSNTTSMNIPASKIILARRTTENHQKIRIEKIPTSLFCLQNRSVSLLRSILKPFIAHRDINEAFALACKDNLSDMLEEIIENLPHLYMMGHDSIVTDCALSAVAYNRPEILRRILHIMYLCELDNALFTRMLATCQILKRNACTEVLKTFDNREPDEIDSLNVTLRLLGMFAVGLSREIVDILNETPNIQERLNDMFSDGKTFMYICIGQYHSIDVNEVSAVLELGVDIDKTDLVGDTCLLQLLSKRTNTLGFRETLEMFLYENPNIDINNGAVVQALALDIHFETKLNLSTMDGDLMLDANEHSLCEPLGAGCFALNFVGPLLIESGFQVARHDLELALDKPFNPIEGEYIRRCLDTPRSLRQFARDVLRKHFKRRQIHRFVELSDMPKIIKDFILLKSHFVCFKP